MRNQQTIGNPVSLSGVGLHTGTTCTVQFKPAKANAGLTFVRVDLPGQPRIPVHADYSNPDEKLHTSLKVGSAEVKTVEHVLATAVGLGIDNMEIHVDGNELPILDGSAKPFVEAVLSAGIVQQDEPCQVLDIPREISLSEGAIALSAAPTAGGFEASFTIDYANPGIGMQTVSFPITPEVFEKEIAPARTFCFRKDVEQMRAAGLIKGGSLDNALVIDDDGTVSQSLRFPDEIARHKLLDFVGDLALVGKVIKGHVHAVRSGHAWNARFAKKILQEVRTKTVGNWPLKPPLDIEQIRAILPHRYPFLLVDRLIEINEEGTKGVGIKNVTLNEWFFQGHFPKKAVMPGVLILEAMAQVGGIILLAKEQNRGQLAFLLSMEDVKFRKPVVPGDQLRLEAEIVKERKRFGRCVGKAYVDGAVVAEAGINFALVDENES